jgi:hypothetical protein
MPVETLGGGLLEHTFISNGSQLRRFSQLAIEHVTARFRTIAGE